MRGSLVIAAIAYQPLRPLTASTPAPIWVPFVSIAVILGGLIFGPLVVRMWRRRHVIRQLTRIVHEQALVALADPLLVHQARRAVSAVRRAGSGHDSPPDPAREHER